MDITATAAAPGSASAPRSANASPQEAMDGQAFLTLLLVQLRNQDPFQPMEPTEMVTQMVQLNMLNELIQIRQRLGGA